MGERLEKGDVRSKRTKPVFYFFRNQNTPHNRTNFMEVIIMGTIIAAVVCAIAIVGGFRTIKLGVRGINRLFDWLEDLF